MFTSLNLRNFKSWQKIEEMRLAPITGLFGTNSSGKTSILQWLLLLKQTVESSDRKQVLNLGDDRSLVQLGTFEDLIFAHAKSEEIKWKVAWSLPSQLKILDLTIEDKRVLFTDDKVTFSSTVIQEPSGPLRVRKMAYEFDGHEFILAHQEAKRRYRLTVQGPSDFKFQRPPGRPWELPPPVKCYGYPDQVNTYYTNAGLLADLQLSLEEQFGRLFYLGPLREYPQRQYTWAGAQPADMGQRGERVVDALLASRERGEKIGRGRGRKKFTVEEYAAYWLKELGLIHDFSIKPITKGGNLYQVLVKKTPQSSLVLITDVGFGVSQILPVIVLCYYVPEGSTLILEQPEIHLHPAVQAGLADVFIDAIEVRGIQIVVESHSEHLLRRLQRRIAEKKVSKDDVALYFCELKQEASKLIHLDLDLFGNIANWPQGFFGDEMGEIAAMARAATKRRLECPT